MLLQTDKCLAQGVSAVTVAAAETAGSRLMDHDKWLVGLQFHTADFQQIWLYYVVDEAFDTTQAVRMAIRRADSDPDRVARGGAQTEPDQVEVQQIHQDALGRFSPTCSL
jgi:hypothetical protein